MVGRFDWTGHGLMVAGGALDWYGGGVQTLPSSFDGVGAYGVMDRLSPDRSISSLVWLALDWTLEN